MAEGVKIRIVGDDSEFVRTLEGLEKRAQGVLAGVKPSGLLAGLSAGIAQLMDTLHGNLTVGVDVEGPAAAGIGAQQEAAQNAAADLAERIRRSLQNRLGAYAAGVQTAEGYRTGLLSRRAAVISAAQSIANAAMGALQGGTSGASGVGTPQRAIIAQPYLPPNGMAAAWQSGASLPELPEMQPIYLNVDGRMLAQVIAGDLRRSIGRRSRSISAGMGR